MGVGFTIGLIGLGCAAAAYLRHRKRYVDSSLKNESSDWGSIKLHGAGSTLIQGTTAPTALMTIPKWYLSDRTLRLQELALGGMTQRATSGEASWGAAAGPSARH